MVGSRDCFLKALSFLLIFHIHVDFGWSNFGPAGGRQMDRVI